jgi:hypothetical protein
MEFDFILHGIWIAVMQMIKQGTDGLSRGEENGLVTGGMMSLHLSATERIPKLGGGFGDGGIVGGMC